MIASPDWTTGIANLVKVLKPWKQHAQVLLLANEFLFVD